MLIINKLRYWLSIVLTEVPVYFIELSAKGNDGLWITNRKQKYIQAPNGTGLSILSDYTSLLRAPLLFPVLSKMLFKKLIIKYQFKFKLTRGRCGHPQVSYIIGHKGEDRLAQLKAVIQSIAAQDFPALECIIVEQSQTPELPGHLPEWVDYYHLPVEEADLYNRSMSFNYGAKLARGEYLVLHDSDLAIPTCYTDCHVHIARKGYDIVNLKRFIFGLSKRDSEYITEYTHLGLNTAPYYVMQNAKGGGSLFISRTAYRKIGGYDERFRGWGGEDNEFWQRAQILRIYPFSSLPIIHLWHAPQNDKRKGKNRGGEHTEDLLETLSMVSIYDRINRLTANSS